MPYVVVLILMALSTIGWSLPSHAESEFKGFYGQVATGFEDNRFSSIKPSWQNITNLPTYWAGTKQQPNQHSSSNPLVLGGGYFHEVTSDWLIGFGVDYHPLAQNSGWFDHQTTNPDNTQFSFGNMSYQVSNRVNLSIMPAYALTPDKLLYLKLGYSTQTLKARQVRDGSDELNSGYERSARQNGMLIGAGYKQTMAHGFYGFVEANSVFYAKATIQGNGSNSINDNIAFSSRPSVSAMNVLFGVGYTFDAFGHSPTPQ